MGLSVSTLGSFSLRLGDHYSLLPYVNSVMVSEFETQAVPS